MTVVFHAHVVDLKANIRGGYFFAKPRSLPARAGSRTSADNPFTDLSTWRVDKEPSPMAAGTYVRFMIVTRAMDAKLPPRPWPVSA
jgi:hypothetical protein